MQETQWPKYTLKSLELVRNRFEHMNRGGHPLLARAATENTKNPPLHLLYWLRSAIFSVISVFFFFPADLYMVQALSVPEKKSCQNKTGIMALELKRIVPF